MSNFNQFKTCRLMTLAVKAFSTVLIKKKLSKIFSNYGKLILIENINILCRHSRVVV